MKILITGATGFVGAHLSLYLISKGNHVVSILHDERKVCTAKLLDVVDKIDWARGDLLDENFVKRVVAEYEVEQVYHVAALPIVRVGHRTSIPIFQTNVFGTLNVLEAIREQQLAGFRISGLLLSTDKVYGDGGSNPYSEDLPLNGTAPYECSKAMADMVWRAYARNWGLDLVVARSCNIYGIADLNSRIIPNTIRRCLAGKPPVVYLKTPYVREFIHIKDLCDALWLLMVNVPKTKMRAFNVGSGFHVEQEELICYILKFFPGLSPIYEEPPPYTTKEIQYQRLDTKLIAEEIGWRATIPFEKGLQEVIEWWRAHEHNKHVARDQDFGTPVS